MAIEFCPLAADWGNMADWAAVVVAGLGAAAVFALSRAANRTSKESLAIARSAHDRQQASADREVQFLALRLFPELNHAANYVAGMTGVLSLTDVRATGAASSEKILASLQPFSLTLCATYAEQIPSLPKAAADAIATALSLEKQVLREVAAWKKDTGQQSDAWMLSSMIRAMKKFSSACQDAAAQLKLVTAPLARSRVTWLPLSRPSRCRAFLAWALAH